MTDYLRNIVGFLFLKRGICPPITSTVPNLVYLRGLRAKRSCQTGVLITAPWTNVQVLPSESV